MLSAHRHFFDICKVKPRFHRRKIRRSEYPYHKDSHFARRDTRAEPRLQQEGRLTYRYYNAFEKDKLMR